MACAALFEIKDEVSDDATPTGYAFATPARWVAMPLGSGRVVDAKGARQVPPSSRRSPSEWPGITGCLRLYRSANESQAEMRNVLMEEYSQLLRTIA